MPVEFLTDEQAESYGTFGQDPTRPELERFFFLDDEDRRLIGKRRGGHSRLGFALQICTVRYIGLFLQDPLAEDCLHSSVAQAARRADPALPGSRRPP
ncbi:DUF4158 domain-containing protein [Amycolatopsis magusensis]|uniref:DUF4158 domain-containing protein n=1 Tax=Amycolatopsis magusensis TaxID=882444 RepID=UPI0037BC8187